MARLIEGVTNCFEPTFFPPKWNHPYKMIFYLNFLFSIEYIFCKSNHIVNQTNVFIMLQAESTILFLFNYYVSSAKGVILKL